ncbi:hypothetical protein [Endozoicomonas sp.]|uniref:hypothetical protein n=1 Tax=Endozoicomonas sp. TaxID=1892382 RepID=UPI003AF893DB
MLNSYKKFYVFLGIEIEPAADRYGMMASTLVYLSPFASASEHPSVATVSIEFDSRKDALRFTEDLVGVLGNTRQRALLFKIEPTQQVTGSER